MERGTFLPWFLHYAQKIGAGLGVGWWEGHWGEEGHSLCLWFSPDSEAGSPCQGQGWEQERHSWPSAPSSRMFSVHNNFEPSFPVTLGNHFHLDAGVSHRKARCNFSSLDLAWMVELTLWPLWNMIAQEHWQMRHDKSKHVALILKHTVRDRSHTRTQRMVWLWG